MKQNEIIQEGPVISGIMNKLKGGTYTAGAERERGNQEINRQLKMAEPNWHKYQAALVAGGTTDAEMPDQITDWARRNFSQDGQTPLMTIPDYASKFPGPLNDQNARDYLKMAAAKYLTRGGPRPAASPAPTSAAPTSTAPATTAPSSVRYGGALGGRSLPQATPAQGAYSVRPPVPQTPQAAAAPAAPGGSEADDATDAAYAARYGNGPGQRPVFSRAPAAPAATPAATPAAPEPQGQALDLDQLKRDREAKLAAGQADQQQAQQQMAATAKANAQSSAADNQRVASVKAIKAKQAAGQLLSTAEKNTLNLAAKDGIHETEYNLLRGKQIVQEAKKLQKKLTAIKKKKKNETIRNKE